MKNERISHEEFSKFESPVLANFTNYFPGLWSTLYGKRVIITERDVILFSGCEYCGGQNTEAGLYNSVICTSCGAPIV